MRLQSRKFQEAASSEREIEGFPAMAEFFRVVMAREEIESYTLLQVRRARGVVWDLPAVLLPVVFLSFGYSWLFVAGFSFPLWRWRFRLW